MHRRMSAGGLAGIGNPQGNLVGKSHITALPTNTASSAEASSMPTSYMAAKLKKGAVINGNKNKTPSKTKVASILQMRINDRRTDKYINKYMKFIHKC